MTAAPMLARIAGLRIAGFDPYWNYVRRLGVA